MRDAPEDQGAIHHGEEHGAFAIERRINVAPHVDDHRLQRRAIEQQVGPGECSGQ